jgi:hypothetical protein
MSETKFENNKCVVYFEKEKNKKRKLSNSIILAKRFAVGTLDNYLVQMMGFSDTYGIAIMATEEQKKKYKCDMYCYKQATNTTEERARLILGW